MQTWDYIVIGGGVIGCSVARRLSLSQGGRVLVLEKEPSPGLHASSRNSGVIHSGINQKPGTLKANLCVRGGHLLKDFCKRNEVAMNEVGTVVLAKSDEQMKVLKELRRRAEENGVNGVQLINSEGLKDMEPFAEAKEALVSPSGAIVDSHSLIAKIAEDAVRSGVSILTGLKVVAIEDKMNLLNIETTRGKEFCTKFLVNCAGAYADRIAHMMDVGEDYCVIPFRGDYYRLIPERSYLVRSMIYPAPNLEMPFLGIHLTRRTDNSVIAGPNSLLAFGREKYRDAGVNWAETLQMLFDIRFARLMSNRQFLKLAYQELKLTLSKEEFAKAAQLLVPELTARDFIPDQSGIRAQLIDKRGHLVDDFVFDRTDKSFHVLNAVSPGMTSALAFAEEVDRLISETR